MSAAVPMQSCPDPETLSAFLDDRLDPKSRLAVVEHLAECGECRDLVVGANECARDEDASDQKIAAGGGGPRVLVPLAAAAALVAILFGITPIRERILGTGMSNLVAAANAAPKRATAARLSGDFAYKVHDNPRGDSEASAEYKLFAAASRIEERVEKNRSGANLHAAGVASLLMKKPHDAVPALEAANQANPGSADVLTDLAAAYLARGVDDDYRRALQTADEALGIERTPAALWNRAYALYLLDDPRAGEAWKDYLAADPGSPWAAEASGYLEQVR